MTNQELSDYLHKVVRSIDLKNEESKEIHEYIKNILLKTESYYEFIEADKNKVNIIKFLEKIAEAKDV
jgi:hypothetical protein